MTTRRLGLAALIVAGLGFGAAALAVDQGRAPSRLERPAAADPAPEPPSPAYLELQKEARPQPRGELADGARPTAPAIARPER
ncbi:MAG: hypothetical protein AB1726_09155 [Planctomycetota bacterium]